MGVGIQCLEACEDLHKYGFIHRDLKPANYACGVGDKTRVIYILDFGIARKVLNVKGELKTPLSHYVDYELIYKCLQEAAKVSGGDINDPHDSERPADETVSATCATIKTSAGSLRPR
ncbi:unnamed protein product [Heligmosomoides polygyrus]|uniref:Protein kinase domain-containing protein n=1 Tax=Heligmosomoides polygyrus TaxID=6339 RepID=A0A183GLT4_HELPZ|nr:unnamed protein product [Heligmosomoides polygyrus]